MNRHIPLDFILSKRKPTWSEIQLGLEEGWITGNDVMKLTQSAVNETENSHDDLREHAQQESKSEYSIRLYWLNIILAWVYEKRHEFDDPLGIVETLYADFDYPDEIRELIRYNTSDNYRPQDFSHEENEIHLLDQWKKYLEAAFL